MKILRVNMKNKDIIERSRAALKAGWRKVKLYFMVGLPGEKEEDLDAIIDLALEIKNVSLSVSLFIPKPHSGFEREGMEELETLNRKKDYLGSRLSVIGY